MSTHPPRAGGPRRAPVVPRATVVIPVRDDAPALAECLRLLAAQTVAPHEVLVVDNHSGDDSAAIAGRWGARVVHESQPGIPAAVATGYDTATGDVILRLDADSRPGPDWVERGLALLADPSVHAASGAGRFDVPGPAGELLGRVYLGAYYRLGRPAAGHPQPRGSCLAIPAGPWREVRSRVGRRLDVHDDMDLALALGPAARVVVDRAWRVEVSARSVAPGRQWVTRWGRAFRTLRHQWAQRPPWQRWRERPQVPSSLAA